MTTFSELKEYVLRGRSGFGRPLPGHRKLKAYYDFGPDDIFIRLHNTDILCITYNGIYTLHSGGHRTATTKKYINKYLPPGHRLFQKNYEWYLQFPDLSIVVFTDGMQIYTNGRPLEIVKGQYLMAI